MIQYHRSMAAGTHNKTLHPMPPGAHQPRTQNARKRYKQPTRQQSAEKTKNTSPRKNNHNLTKRLGLSCTTGRRPDDDGRAASAATEAVAGGIVTTATQTRNRLPPASTTAPAETAINQQQPPVDPNHSNLCRARALRAGEANHRKLEQRIPTNTTSTSKFITAEAQQHATIIWQHDNNGKTLREWKAASKN